jgi:hypothetical protein
MESVKEGGSPNNSEGVGYSTSFLAASEGCDLLDAWKETSGARGLIANGIPGLEVGESGIPLCATVVGSRETLTGVTDLVFSLVGEFPFFGGPTFSEVWGEDYTCFPESVGGLVRGLEFVAGETTSRLSVPLSDFLEEAPLGGSVSISKGFNSPLAYSSSNFLVDAALGGGRGAGVSSSGGVSALLTGAFPKKRGEIPFRVS